MKKKLLIGVASLVGLFIIIFLATAPKFEVSNLNVSPAEVVLGDTVTVTVEVRNVGVRKGTHELELIINEVVEQSKNVTLNGGETTTISFSIEKDIEGSYSVESGTLTGVFEVVEPERTLTVHFIDVGQGDSILLDLGDIEVLIDGGDKSPGVVSYIDDYIDGPLEAMIATHPHADHIGGLIGVLDAFEVDEIWLNGDTSTSQTYSQFMSAVNAEGAEVFVARRGDTIQAGNLTFNVLHPVNLSGTINNNSIVLSLSYGQVDFLFTGDAEQEAEASMLAEGIVPDVEILKVGHHGSKSSSSAPFLDAVKPEVAIYMAGEGNSYGHPHQETITALAEVGAKIYGTDIHGTIIVTTGGKDYSVVESEDVRVYENIKYGYTLDYPSSWTLEVSKPEKVFIWTPHDNPNPAMLFIYVQEMPTSIPLEECPTDWLRVHEEQEGLIVLSSRALENKWDRLLEYTTTKKEGGKTYYKTYFKRVGSLLYLIDVSSVSAGKPSELQDIVDSFEVTREPSSDGVEYLIYENPEYGYKIEYPQDWELIDTSTHRTILGVEWGAIFGFVTINVAPFGKPIDEVADIYALYLADTYVDEAKDFKVVYSHSLSGEWDWVLGFTYVFTHRDTPERGTVNVSGEAYIVQTPEYEIVVQWEGEESQAETCKQIVDSFVLLEVKPPPPPEETSNVQITRIYYDGLVYRVESDEYVEIRNLGDASQDLQGWVLKDISEGYPSFTFPSYILAPGESIRVYTNEYHPEWGGFSFGYGKAIWNNTDHDWAALYNAQGQEVSRKSY